MIPRARRLDKPPSEWQRLNPLILIPECLHFSGRFSRNEYFVAVTVVSLVNVAIFLIVAFAISVIHSLLPDIKPSTILLLLVIADVLAAALSLPFTVGATARRLHDLGRSGIQTVLLLVPIVGQVLAFELLFKPAPEGALGRPPRSHIFDTDA
jgi:uncharacterized membrane protein YhaH (DUF805 family)